LTRIRPAQQRELEEFNLSKKIKIKIWHEFFSKNCKSKTLVFEGENKN